MKKPRLAGIGLTVLLIILLSGVARAASSANYALNWQLFSGGGAPATSGTVTLKGSLGQTAVGAASSTTLGVSSGYWYGITSQSLEVPGSNTLYLPLIFKSLRLQIEQ